MRKALPSTSLLITLTLLASFAAFLAWHWSAGRTEDPLLQLVPAAAAYGLAIAGLSRLTELDTRHTLTSSLHLLLVPVVAAVLFVAVVAGATEKHIAASTGRPPWGMQIAQAAQNAMRPTTTA